MCWSVAPVKLKSLFLKIDGKLGSLYQKNAKNEQKFAIFGWKSKNFGETFNLDKALFICPILKTKWQIRRFIIGEHPPNWSAKKLL